MVRGSNLHLVENSKLQIVVIIEVIMTYTINYYNKNPEQSNITEETYKLIKTNNLKLWDCFLTVAWDGTTVLPLILNATVFQFEGR